MEEKFKLDNYDFKNSNVKNNVFYIDYYDRDSFIKLLDKFNIRYGKSKINYSMNYSNAGYVSPNYTFNIEKNKKLNDALVNEYNKIIKFNKLNIYNTKDVFFIFKKHFLNTLFMLTMFFLFVSFILYLIYLAKDHIKYFFVNFFNIIYNSIILNLYNLLFNPIFCSILGILLFIIFNIIMIKRLSNLQLNEFINDKVSTGFAEVFIFIGIMILSFSFILTSISISFLIFIAIALLGLFIRLA